ICKQALLSRRIQGIKITNGLPSICLNQFVDDNFMMGKASVQEATNFKSVLMDYELVLGQR
ncbi:hypothetical protein KI387_010279, partial [Taxus chinensis]